MVMDDLCGTIRRSHRTIGPVWRSIALPFGSAAGASLLGSQRARTLALLRGEAVTLFLARRVPGRVNYGFGSKG